jgi:transposase
MGELKVLDEHAAFVDVGSEQMHVSIAGGTPRVFGALTRDLHALRDWLLEQGVRSVAMEATGVYWLPLYSVLEAALLEVRMVDGRQTRHVSGRKSDMQDCQWGATLHMHGLLRPGFVPPEMIRRLQNYLRLRADHLTMAGSHVQHIQKALELMNIKVHDVISDITGASGFAMVRAILQGERDPERLLALCDVQIRRHKADRVRESLRGTWAGEHLFALKQAVQSWDHYQAQIGDCDQEIEALLHVMGEEHRDDPQVPLKGPRKRPGANAPTIPELRSILVMLCNGHDATVLPAHTEYSVLQLIGEVGTDLTNWRTEKHFTAWMGLAPASAQSGKRKRSVKRRRNRTGRLFCVMARSLARSNKIALGGFYRRIAARKGGLHANVALARKLAVLFWRVMVKGVEYVEHGLAHYEAKLLEGKQKALLRLAKQLGRELVPLAKPTPAQCL